MNVKLTSNCEDRYGIWVDDVLMFVTPSRYEALCFIRWINGADMPAGMGKTMVDFIDQDYTKKEAYDDKWEGTDNECKCMHEEANFLMETLEQLDELAETMKHIKPNSDSITITFNSKE